MCKWASSRGEKQRAGTTPILECPLTKPQIVVHAINGLMIERERDGLLELWRNIKELYWVSCKQLEQRESRKCMVFTKTPAMETQMILGVSEVSSVMALFCSR